MTRARGLLGAVAACLTAGAAVIAVAGIAAMAGVAAQEPSDVPSGARPVIVAELDSIIHPIAAEYLDDVLQHARASDAEAVVVVLETPGGLLESTRGMVSAMVASPVPVVVFVGPAGARAASAGFILAMAADVVVMAPGTHIGAAHPVSGTGQALDETASKKAAEDVAAYVRSLAVARGRNVELAAAAVTESRAFTDTEALAADPPLIDFSAPDVQAVVDRLDGRTVRRFDGSTVTIHTAGARLDTVEMTRRQRFLSALAHPQIAYYLITLGILGLTVELWNPGLILPGVAGGLCLLLAFFAFQILPVSTTGVLLVVFGIGLLALELKVPSFGALGVGGAISLVVGSVMITDTVPGLAVSRMAVVPVAVALSLLFLALGRLALRAQRRPAVTGREGMLGAVARVHEALEPDVPGVVHLRGEIWRALSRTTVEVGRTVRVVEMDGLTLLVEPAGDVPAQGDP